MIPKLKQFNLEQLVTDKKKLMLAAVICLILIFVDISFVMKLQLAGLSAQGSKIAKLKSDIDKLNSELAKMKSFRDKDGKKQAQAAQKKLVSEGQITTLLQNISETAKINGVRISQIKQAPEAQEVKKKPGSGAKPASGLISYLISLDLTTDYHTLGKFLNQLENGEIPIAVQDIRITPGTQNTVSQVCFVTLRTYVRK